MEIANKQESVFPAHVVAGALSAAVVTGLGLTAAALDCRWSADGNRATWWHLAFVYVNQAMIVLWLLVLPSVAGGQRAATVVKSGASPAGIAGAVCLAAAVASVPAYVWSAWMSQIAWINISALLLLQGVMGLLSIAAGVWLHRVSKTAQVYVMGLLAAIVIGGPMLIYLQAEFLPESADGWRWFVPAFQIAREAHRFQSVHLFWSIAVYGFCGLCGLVAAAFGAGVAPYSESKT